MWRLPWRWHQLTHVCQRWRSVVFASPKFLDLALVCGPSTPMELIGIWPPLPIIIQDEFHSPMLKDYDLDAAIVPPGRVCQIDLAPSSLHWQRLTSVMQEQFPALIHLRLDSALHDSPLGSSGWVLRWICAVSAISRVGLRCISCASEISLIRNCPCTPQPSEYSLFRILSHPKRSSLAWPYWLTSSLSPLNSNTRSRPDQESRLSPPPTRTVLPALTLFQFQGASEYLDGVMARIDVPLLDSFFITFLNQFIFDISQLAQFTRRTTSFQALNEAHVNFDYGRIQVESLPPIWTLGEKPGLSITCRRVLGAFKSGAGLYIALPFHLHSGTPLHVRASIYL